MPSLASFLQTNTTASVVSLRWEAAVVLTVSEVYTRTWTASSGELIQKSVVLKGNLDATISKRLRARRMHGRVEVSITQSAVRNRAVTKAVSSSKDQQRIP